MAISLAMGLALLIKPGEGQSELLKSEEVASYQKELQSQQSADDSPMNQTFDQTLISFFPKNPI